ncbi:hypothetical protein SORBI_3004G345001 [Sorghum bicolor]|uniref:Uncharacterized protein n=1 Tax=Sorghum bicolor TaxID=4558 RepID=A0A1Z5RQB5_SORBI|nr:hypothetical protein SORBI_3004G345001 [Sorghum bicolor]
MEDWWLGLVWWIVSFLPGTFSFLLWKKKGAVAFLLLLLLLLSPSENSVLLRFLPAPSPRSIAACGPGLCPRDGRGGA